MDQQTITNCPQCPRNCPIERVSCERGEMLVKKIKSGEPIDLESMAKKHGGHHHDGHGHGKHGRPNKNTLEGLLAICGHTLHRKSGDGTNLFAVLDTDEQDTLKTLLSKLVDSWE